jgi:hypothetical protein
MSTPSKPASMTFLAALAKLVRYDLTSGSVRVRETGIGRAESGIGRDKWQVVLLGEGLWGCCPTKSSYLTKDEDALVMHGICDFSPSLYLFLGIDTWDEVSRQQLGR